jgi:hypothetical protein
MKSPCAVLIFSRWNEPARSLGLFPIAFPWDAASTVPAALVKKSLSPTTEPSAIIAIWAMLVAARVCRRRGSLTQFA